MIKTWLSAQLFGVGLCLAGAGNAQTFSIHELFGFPCSSSTLVCPDGEGPNAIIQASDGNFYGVAGQSIPGGGTVFKITSSGEITELYRFPNNTTTGFFDNGNDPNCIVEGSDGMLYGAAGSGGTNAASSGTLWRIHKDGSGFEVLQRFETNSTTGSFPNNIIPASDGNLYGTTGYGGNFSGMLCQGLGCGVVFRLATGGVYTRLHAFNGTTETNYPIGLVQATDGNLYGATGSLSGGALFRVTTSGEFTTLYNFGYPSYALAPLTQASNGLLYGFSHVESAPTIELFSLSLKGQVQQIAQITQALFKQYGVGKILQASDGNLWTTAVVAPAGSGYGRVFSVTPGGTIEQSISFNGADGGFPVGGVIQASDGTLYGTAAQRGTTASGGKASGVIYTISGLAAP